jgi:hypothetical protein
VVTQQQINKVRLQEFKNKLKKTTEVGPLLLKVEGGKIIPPYYHITEMGIMVKHVIDCGGTLRKTEYITFQVWTADDFDHRMTIEKLLDIIEKGEKFIGAVDIEIEMEYQTDTIGRYSISADPTNELMYILSPKKTNCLAPDKCGITPERKSTNDQQPKPQCGPSCC